MRVFVTGATGFIGSAVMRELIGAGHEVTGLARSAKAAARLEASGAKVQRGAMEDVEGLSRAAAQADGVIHTAFFHSPLQAGLATRLAVILGGSPSGIVGRFLTAAVEADRRAIEALGHALRGGDRALVAAFPTMAMAAGRLATETDAIDPRSAGGPRGRSEREIDALAARGVRATIIRLPPSVHDESRQGLVTRLAEIARKRQVSSYIGDGKNRWGAVHRRDAARLFRLALENGAAGERYHAVAEEGVPVREIAEAVGAGLGVRVASLPRDLASKQFGWLAPFLQTDNPVSSAATQARLNWQPTHPPLMADLAAALRNAQAAASSPG